ncbi:hypothetical protein PENCOP_c005G03879 [Penicillium coprophilum]|uniref:Fido domain-containing protein n=1 Tax=Penicillium coprophilum TaxID=36646 RepID=A0A1V6URE4_9EURO|nr:hypothetical protein PENCOP_c005G03879 [Penicillium coprophilum]
MFAALRRVDTRFTITMAEDCYDSKISHKDFDPDPVFQELITLTNQLFNLFKTELTPHQEAYMGSNMIEKAGSSSEITLKLCLAIFRGQEIPEEIEEQDQGYLLLKESLIHRNLPTDTSAVLRGRGEVVQHAKAAAFMIDQLCIRGQDLSEEILLEAHRILTYKVDAEITPWIEYSGVYRTDEVSAGLHAFPYHSLVPSKMTSMFRELKYDLKAATTSGMIDPVALASKYTHIFVNIHPFIDGNGRMCQLILNSMLLKFGTYVACIGVDRADRSIHEEIGVNRGVL